MVRKATRGEQKLNRKNLAFVCSALRGANLEENQKLARLYCLYATEQGAVPFAPHLFFTQFLEDTNEEQRRLGIECGKAILSQACAEVWVFVVNSYISAGMSEEIDFAYKIGKPVKWFVAGWDAISDNVVITRLNHLPDDAMPSQADLQTDSSVVDVFRKIADRLNSGEFYEDCLDDLDGVLDTALSERDREIECDWQLDMDNRRNP